MNRRAFFGLLPTALIARKLQAVLPKRVLKYKWVGEWTELGIFDSSIPQGALIGSIRFGEDAEMHSGESMLLTIDLEIMEERVPSFDGFSMSVLPGAYDEDDANE